MFDSHPCGITVLPIARLFLAVNVVIPAVLPLVPPCIPACVIASRRFFMDSPQYRSRCAVNPGKTSPCPFLLQPATALRVPILKLCLRRRGLSAAIAWALPPGCCRPVFSALTGRRDDRQPAEPFSNAILIGGAERQPQWRTFPQVSLRTDAFLSFSQSHLHFHTMLPPSIRFSVEKRPVSFPNHCPAKSILLPTAHLHSSGPAHGTGCRHCVPIRSHRTVTRLWPP